MPSGQELNHGKAFANHGQLGGNFWFGRRESALVLLALLMSLRESPMFTQELFAPYKSCTFSCSFHILHCTNSEMYMPAHARNWWQNDMSVLSFIDRCVVKSRRLSFIPPSVIGVMRNVDNNYILPTIPLGGTEHGFISPTFGEFREMIEFYQVPCCGRKSLGCTLSCCHRTPNMTCAANPPDSHLKVLLMPVMLATLGNLDSQFRHH